ncbi:MAG: hypothetical protein RJA22_651 [Verrucomicrobiota bacterium]|jgi:CAAX prenyl protease-like protein
MTWLRSQLTRTPLVARVAPFLLFVILTFAQGSLGATGPYWLYLLKTVLGVAMLIAVWPAVAEMRWTLSWEGVVTGVAVFGLWVGLDPLCERLGWSGSYPKMDLGEPWNPFRVCGEGSALAWMFVAVRLAGSSMVVPMLEEVFYRSFLYRYAEKADFLSVPLGRFLPRPFLIASVIFALAHREWLAALLCAFAYQGLVCWKKRLGDAMTAHAVTNLLLGLAVVYRGQWQFW